MVIDKFFIFLSNFTLFRIVDRLFLNEKKHKDNIILCNYGMVYLEIKAQKHIVKSKRSIFDIYILVLCLHI